MGKETNRAKWTFMVFIAGDNNLDPAALKDIAEMAKVGSSQELNIIYRKKCIFVHKVYGYFKIK